MKQDLIDKRIPEIDKLYEDVISYRSTAQFENMLNFITRFRHMAPYNAMLVYIQKPGSEFVTSAKEWRVRYNRIVKPDAIPLVILQPFGPVTFVYEYNDTVGDPFPDSVVEPFKCTVDIGEAMLEHLINNIKAEGVETCFSNYGTGFAGQISYHDEETILQMRIPSGICYLRSYHTIRVNNNLSPAEKYATILHELAHLYCGHLYHDHTIERWLPCRYDIGLSREQKEFEAETACWLVCERMGITNPSAKYLAGYLKDNKEIPHVSVDVILKAAGILETFSKVNVMKRRKELVIRVEKTEDAKR